jgi:general nucleoside transport system ATP-binding protein
VLGRVIDARHPSDPAEMRSLGLAHVPEDRLRQGMVAAFHAWETSILGYQAEPPFCRNYLLDVPAVGRHCATLMDRFDVRPRAPALRSSNFSGGNQQKLVLAREFASGPKLLIAAYPTRGLDIGATEFVWKQLVSARDAGLAVLLISANLEEILALADRVGVIYDGRITAELDGSKATMNELGLYMTGARSNREPAA